MRFLNVLFLCTGNSARSVMAEALLTARGGDRFRAFSAGSHPSGKVNPFALERVRELGLSTDGFRSKSWDEFAVEHAPTMDIVITVCDAAASEACPIWPGAPFTAHWGFADPAAVAGSDGAKRAAFDTAFRHIQRRVDALIALPWDALDDQARRASIKSIGDL